MKSLILTLLLALPVQAAVTETTVSIVGTRDPVYGLGGITTFPPELFLDAKITLEPTSDPVWIQREQRFAVVPGTYKILSLDGTYNGHPATLDTSPAFAPWISISQHLMNFAWTGGYVYNDDGPPITFAISQYPTPHFEKFSMAVAVQNINPVPDPMPTLLSWISIVFWRLIQ